MSLPLAITPGDSGHITHHEEIHDILSDVELADLWVVNRFLSDLLANRGSAGRAGSLFLATNVGDTGSLSLDNGSAWNDLYKFMPNATWDLRSGSGNDNIAGFRIPACRVGKSVAQSINSTGTGTWADLTWDDETGANHFNNDGTTLHNASSNSDRFKATRGGAWGVGAYIRWTADGTGERHIRVQKNGSHILGRDSRDAGDGAAQEFEHTVMGTMVVEMEVGDYLQVQVSQNSGGNLDVHQNSVAWFYFLSDVA